MKRRMILGCLWGVICTLLLMEAGLRWIDPLGIRRHFEDQMQAGERIEQVPGRGYAFGAGTYALSNWRMTILDDYTRRVPDTNQDADCTLVLLGDSVTQAWGVDDAETWANLVARRFADVRVINAGVSGYNSAAVCASAADFPTADALIYFVIDNDPNTKDAGLWPGKTASNQYLVYVLIRWTMTGERDWPRFYADLDALAADPRVALVAFNDGFGRDLDARYTIDLIAHYDRSHTNSFADAHANAAGNREIAEAIAPVVARVVEQHCN